MRLLLSSPGSRRLLMAFLSCFALDRLSAQEANAASWSTAAAMEAPDAVNRILVCWAVVAGVAVVAQADDATAKRPSYDREETTRVPVVFGAGAVRGSRPSFTPDGTTVFTHAYSEGRRRHAILVSRFCDGRWGRSEVAPFSGVGGRILQIEVQPLLDGERAGKDARTRT